MPIADTVILTVCYPSVEGAEMGVCYLVRKIMRRCELNLFDFSICSG